MADDTQAMPAAGGSLTKNLLMFGIVGLVCGIAGFALPVLAPQLFGLNGPVKQDKPKVDLPEPSGKAAFITFGQTVVNLDDGRLTRYLRISITLQVDAAQEAGINELVEGKKAILKSWLLSYLSDQNMDEIRGASGQNRIRREIQDHFNTVLFVDGIDRVQDVLFEEFNVQ